MDSNHISRGAPEYLCCDVYKLRRGLSLTKKNTKQCYFVPRNLEVNAYSIGKRDCDKIKCQQSLNPRHNINLAVIYEKTK